MSINSINTINNINIRIGEKPQVNPLPMGGSDRDGNRYAVNSQYLTKNDRPILPIMGEFHFSRYAPEEWEEAILKMQAGGVHILATYVFWIHHEEKKGVWDFSGRRDIRAFLELCKKVHMPVWLRIGPWAHGECRNGGFPDWLVEETGHNGLFFDEARCAALRAQGQQPHEARSNDSLYMTYVRRFWERLAQEISGTMCKDGGAVIGFQLENEYCHAGGPRDRAQGIAHIRALKELALSLGFETPYYTATGWGGALAINGEMLPVFGGYVDAPWANHTEEMPACENFLILPCREEETTFSLRENPYLTAELGGGLQETAHRRTYPFAQDIEAQSLCMLGAGANLLGYYMYHGGVNPDGNADNRYATYQESKASGYFNDLPIKSYDFEACIRESGKLNGSYHKLKKLHLLAECFGERLAPAAAYFPDVAPRDAEDLETPRISARYHHDTGEGFLFVNNHQRLRQMKPIRGLCAEIAGVQGSLCEIKDICCASGACMVLPFGLRMGESRLRATNAALLARLGGRYFFYYDEAFQQGKPYFDYEGAPYENVVLLTKEEAENAYLFGDRLYITPRPMLWQDGTPYVLCGAQEERIRFYEEDGEAVELHLLPPENMTEVSVKFAECGTDTAARVLETTDRYNDSPAPDGCRVYEIELSAAQPDFVQSSMRLSDSAPSQTTQSDEATDQMVHEIYLWMDFAGDRAQLYDEDRLLTDWFANGDDWAVALKRYGYPKKLYLVVYPFAEAVYYDLAPRKGCALSKVCAETEYKRAL
ncbi:MAG: beta-galactosidase [Roseburia sp.]|nr:beta-galactosidase [Roseburia sp.]